MNIFLAPGPLDYEESKEQYWQEPQGHLVAENAAVLGIGRGYVQNGHNLNYLKTLHCEFEGDGIRGLLDNAYIVLAFLLAGLVVSGLWIFSLFFALFAILSGIFLPEPGELGSGNPLDVDPFLGFLSHGDVVIVKGEWVYDSLHGGWNEIHPVRNCQVIGHLDDGQDWRNFKFTDLATGTEFKLDTRENVETFRKFWCDALDGAKVAEDGGNRDDPQHDWGIHPSIDGCKGPIIIL
jgi:hypothetical protein